MRYTLRNCRGEMRAKGLSRVRQWTDMVLLSICYSVSIGDEISSDKLQIEQCHTLSWHKEAQRSTKRHEETHNSLRWRLENIFPFNNNRLCSPIWNDILLYGFILLFSFLIFHFILCLRVKYLYYVFVLRNVSLSPPHL